MGYNVIHMIEAADWLEELEYSQLVEQCRQIFRILAGTGGCGEQICMTFSDKVKEISIENGQWPGETAFRRPRRRKKTDRTEQKICFEEALQAAAVPMRNKTQWVVILYTAGAVRRSKKTMLAKWKKTLAIQPILLAVTAEHADRSFLESYTEEGNVFDIGMTEEVYGRLNEYEKSPNEERREPQKSVRKGVQKKEELWKVIRDCFV